jgi:Tol biopolymer transport system component
VLNRGPSPDTLQGRITWPKDGDLWVYDLSAKQDKKITNLPRGAAVTGASWSPDGQRVVFSQFGRRPNERASGADLYVASADGSDAHLFAERDAANTVLDTPYWAPSGRVYYTLRRVQNGRESQTIVRQTEGGEPETLVENAYSPTVTPDESTLVYLRTTRAGQSLMKKSIGQPDDGCELLSDQVFQYLSQPRISPDGKKVALGGSGDANPGPSSCGANNGDKPAAAGPRLAPLAAQDSFSARQQGVDGLDARSAGSPGAGSQAGSAAGDQATRAAGLQPPRAESDPAAAAEDQATRGMLAALMPLLDLAEWLNVLPATAEAHGLPADVYTLGLDGGGLQRVADIKDDDPTVAWSPDGSRLAIFGVAALYVVDSKGGPTQKVVEQGGYGGLDWTR